MDFFAEDRTSNPTLARYLFIAVLLVTAVAYCINVQALPFADYDEATYAHVTVDTLASGNILTLSRFDQQWFEKPPLYFWLAMGSISAFGEDEFSFRLPSVLFAIASIAFVWLLVWRLTRDSYAASLSALILLASAFYYIAARQVRLDVPAISMILAALVALVYGWEKRGWLLAIGPALAIGFMFKSFLVFFAAPVIVLFCLVYRKWGWLADWRWWVGVVLGLGIVIPWHWYEFATWGDAFVSQYFGYQVFQRAGTGITETSGFSPLGYLKPLLYHGEPWVITAVLAAGVWWWIRKKDETAPHARLIMASIVSGVSILAIVSFLQTKILTYILPLFPFVAVASGVSAVALFRTVRHRGIRFMAIGVLLALGVVSALLASGRMGVTFSEMHFAFDSAERTIGKTVARGAPEANLYVLDWPVHESLRYYSGQQLTQIAFPPAPGTTLKAPWYLVVTNLYIPYFIDEGTRRLRPDLGQVSLEYSDGKLFLIRGEHDLTFGGGGE